MPAPLLVRRLAATLLLAVAALLPAAAGAQAVTYAFSGAIEAEGLSVPVSFQLTGDAAGVIDVVPPPADFTGFVLQDLDGALTLGDAATSVFSWYAGSVLAGVGDVAPLPGLYFGSANNAFRFLLTGGGTLGYDLRQAFAPADVTLEFTLGDAVYTGGGTFSASLGVVPPVSTVPEPASYALVGAGAGLLALARWRRMV